MDKALSFFRVFDVAFFAPGAMLYLALHLHEWKLLGKFDPLAVDAFSITAKDLVSILMTIALIYVLGITIHGLQRLTHHVIGSDYRCRFYECVMNIHFKETTLPQRLSWYQKVDKNARIDLGLYFWYMRATCWNLAFAGLISAVLYLFPAVWHALVFLIFAVLAYWLGIEYDRTLARAVKDLK